MSQISTTPFTKTIRILFLTLFVSLPFVAASTSRANDVSGELKRWHRVSITFNGPQTSETASPNPFSDYRLLVTFTHSGSGTSYVVPGFFAADGNAAETSARSGNKWRVHFTPDQTGAWTYKASFRTGSYVAVSTDLSAGTPVSFDGESGSFVVVETDKKGNDFRAKGALRYVNDYYLQFAGNREYFLKVGPDGPENLLAYRDFDGTYDTDCRGDGIDGSLHSYEPHIADWKAGDPAWQNGKGKGLIGAMNYLGQTGANSIYFLTYNIDRGDGCDVWPWVNESSKERFDVSKLDQWEVVFNHMDASGIQLHVILSERQNAKSIGPDNRGEDLNNLRKLYYRELIARFGHHLALQWNLGEENTNNDRYRIEFAEYIRSVDPYDHPITVHTSDSKAFEFYAGLLGEPFFEATSLQANIADYNELAIYYRRQSQAAGRRWAVYADEQDPNASRERADLLRKSGLWGNLMGGGAGVEWYFTFDLSLEDFRIFDDLWADMGHASRFFQAHLPFQKMEPANELTASTTDFVFAQPGQTYAVYLPEGGTADLNLSGSSSSTAFDVWWYNPRSGGALERGSQASIQGGATRNLGRPPSNTSSDWVALVKTGSPATGNQPPLAAFETDVTSGTAPLDVLFDATGSSDPDGTIASYLWDFGDGSSSSDRRLTHTYAEPGTYRVSLTVTDDQGLSDQAEKEILVEASGGGDLPVVYISRIDADAAEPGGKGNSGKVRVQRSGSLSNALTIHFSLAGSATEGVDYAEIGTTLELDPGQERKNVAILPIDDEAFESEETVLLMLQAGAGYKLDSEKTRAEIVIYDDESEVAAAPIYRVNAGGGGVSDAYMAWGRDTKNKPSPYVNAEQGDNKTDKDVFYGQNNTNAPSEIFDKSRWDPAGEDRMKWAFPVEDGAYQVRLYFAETGEKTSQEGDRYFDVIIEGRLVLDDYDVVEDVGFQTATMKSFTTTVSDGTLNVDFHHVHDNPFVSGIAIVPSQTASAGGPGIGGVPSVASYDQLGSGRWELVGLPLKADVSGLMAMQPAPDVLVFNGGNFVTGSEDVAPGKGFWLKADDDQTHRYEGERIDSLTLQVHAGWNLISGPSCDVELNRIGGVDRLVPHTLYRYEEGYVRSHRIEQGRGYWVYAREAGDISLSCAAGTPAPIDPLNINTRSFAEIIVTDSDANSKTLYFGDRLDGDFEASIFSLPPRSPGAGLDVRFSNDSWLIEDERASIELHGGTGPLSVKIDDLPDAAGNVFVLTLMQDTTPVESVKVRRGDVVQLAAGVNRLVLESVDDWKAGLPESFELAGNFPNPFNPETTIVFALPERAEVQVDVYDMLGRRVISTDRRVMESAPRHEIRLSAGDLASGTYLYQVKATIGRRVHIESGTMILLK